MLFITYIGKDDGLVTSGCTGPINLDEGSSKEFCIKKLKFYNYVLLQFILYLSN
jgi:hypothetical protein